MPCGWPGLVHSVESVIVLQILVAALNVAFVLSVTSRLRMYGALATASLALGLLTAPPWPGLVWLPYAVAATYLGALINRRVESSTEVTRRPRVPRL